jgi:hypothetical protein
MSGSLDPLVNVWQLILRMLSAIEQKLAGGIAIVQAPPSYTVASLPTTGNGNGAPAWASNGRKPGEGAGAGTGVPVFWNPTTGSWYSYLSGAPVAA